MVVRLFLFAVIELLILFLHATLHHFPQHLRAHMLLLPVLLTLVAFVAAQVNDLLLFLDRAFQLGQKRTVLLQLGG